MIDGPSTGVARQPLRYREMTLTPLKIQLPLAAGTTAVKKAFDASGVAEKWANTKWAKTLQARETRKNTTDCKFFSLHSILTLQSSASTFRSSRSSAAASSVPPSRRSRPKLEFTTLPNALFGSQNVAAVPSAAYTLVGWRSSLC